MADHVTPVVTAATMLGIGFPVSGKAPAGLCGEHKRVWRAWWDYAQTYDPRHPKDFGSVGPIQDARTTHAERRADWLRKGLKQLQLVEQICRSGQSEQCGEARR